MGSTIGSLSVRPMRADDISSVVDYWASSSKQFLAAMGADPERIPSPKKFRQNLKDMLEVSDLEQVKTAYLIWCLDGRAIGFSSLKNIVFGDRGEMHLHIWDGSFRGKGYGAILFCKAVIVFFSQFNLKKIICEPLASNPFPNGMLKKIGFPLIKTYTGASSELSLTGVLNKYDVQKAIAERYLKRSESRTHIRKAMLADAAEIANVHINSWREAYQGLLPQNFLDDRPLNFKNRHELWKKVTADESQVTFVAESADHGVVGFVNGKEARDEGYETYVEVWSLYLLRHYHGQRVGLNLLKTYFDVFFKRGFTKGYLWVLKDNPTIRFYEKTGARRTDEVKGAVIGGQNVEELCYVWNDIRLQVRQ